jgi:predicted type IV restriction endonuclease
MSKAPDQVTSLIENFKRNYSAYKSGDYKEEQLKQEFLNPLFEALEWDVTNKEGNAPQYRDVIFEDSIKVASGTQAPDYCFTLSGARKFFVEAKKPSVDIQNNQDAVYQLRRYAWTAKLPLSILTNFDSLAIYESRKRPSPEDRASTERIKLLRYEEFADKWNEIADIFSRKAVRQGSFDKFAEATEKKRGTQQVGDEFLNEIEKWRDDIARNVALRNPALSIHDLNYSVQRTVDRIVFLRMCEDRGIEPYGQLQSLLKTDHAYEALCQLYKRSDEKYNSGLFHFDKEKGRNTPPDEITLGLGVDDAVLKGIIKDLYYPESPYEFSVLPPEILGNIYERFLGKVIRLTEGHRAKVEEKPEVKKAGGVYYTPKYIVDYIVGNTVGKLCEEKSPKAISELRILDPACGSGSFLLGAYAHLLRYHIDYYTKQGRPDRFQDQVYQGKGGAWYLTIKEKKRILLNNIYGVDIDPQAVEVTKLGLLLKVLEGESKDVFERQQKLFRERALPDLDNNIKCGNSLVGPDFYQGGVQTSLDAEKVYDINAFDWGKEFKGIISNGGFDAVIGNPPYVRQEMLSEFKDYFQRHYKVYHGVADLYTYFIERAFSLLKEGGIFSYIVANKWMRTTYGEPLRKWLREQCIEELVDFGDLPVFKEVTTYPCILRIRRSPPREKLKVVQVKTLEFGNLQDYVTKYSYAANRSSLEDKGWSLSNELSRRLLEKVKSSGTPLKEYVGGKVFRGIITGLNEAFVVNEETRRRLVEEDPRSIELIRPFLLGKDVKRYSALKETRYLILLRNGWTREKAPKGSDRWEWFKTSYPAVARHLERFEEKAKERWDKGECWWELRPCDFYDYFEKGKIIYPNICKQPEFTFDGRSFFTNQKCFFIPVDDKYLLGVLNSRLTNFLFGVLLPKLRGGFYEPSYVYLKDFPIHCLELSDPTDKAQHDRIVEWVTQMLELHKKLAITRTEHDRMVIKRQIGATNEAIDKLVYGVYGLTPEEVKIIEEGSKQ